MDYKEYTGKTVNDLITDACQDLGVTSDRLDYVVVDEGSSGFLGLGAKNAVIKARIKSEEVIEAVKAEVEEAVKAEVKEVVKAEVKEAVKAEVKEEIRSEAAKSEEARAVKEEKIIPVSDPAKYEASAKKFLEDVFKAMNMEATIKTSFELSENALDIELAGNDMGILIGKRGATLDSLQYLVSLVVNKDSEQYIRVKVDTEDYRERRRATLENLAKNVSAKVKRTGRPYELESMNPYERRIIHSALQDNDYVYTYSEGEGTNRHIVVALKEGVRPTGDYGRSGRRGRRY
ncbi:MAG: Jag N-terminal domain-containing protein [Lachnospiraceae bacterium]|nr:Jag N-terminal domain-containing protein [Lachnospiraceae bacterium]